MRGMRVTFQLTPEDYYQGLLAWRSLRAWQRWVLRFSYVVVGTAFLGSLLVLVFDQKSPANHIFVFGTVFGPLWFGYMLFAPRFSSRRQFRNSPSAQSPVTLDISDAALEIHSAHGDSKVAWSAYIAWAERKSVFVILPQPRIYVPIPKRAFTEEQITEFRELLRRNIVAKG